MRFNNLLVVVLLASLGSASAAFADNKTNVQNPMKNLRKMEKKESKLSEFENMRSNFINSDKATKLLSLGQQAREKRNFKKAEQYFIQSLNECRQPPADKKFIAMRDRTIKRNLTELNAIQSLYRSLGQKEKADHLLNKVLLPWSTQIYGEDSFRVKNLKKYNEPPRVLKPATKKQIDAMRKRYKEQMKIKLTEEQKKALEQMQKDAAEVAAKRKNPNQKKGK